MRYGKFYNTIGENDEIEIPESLIKERREKLDDRPACLCKLHNTYFLPNGDGNNTPAPCWQCWNEVNKADGK